MSKGQVTPGTGARPLAALGWLVLLGLGGRPEPVAAEESRPAAARDIAFFESRIRPLLVEKCQGCHGSTKQKGGLRVDDRESLLKGGDSGAAIRPGAPDESLLLLAVSYRDDLKMPPKGKLSGEEIAALRRWVAGGAPWPERKRVAGARPAAGPASPQASAVSSRQDERDLWAFRPLQVPRLPAVGRSDWVRNPIDAFVLATLESNGLDPAPPADRRTLLRRVTFDLIGLPPTPEETAAFQRDASPDAYERVVERLLASPHHGERWGRHWLDVARYADSNGMDENLGFAHAWRYRDYVIDAFNRDLPFDAFLREQLAGDLLPSSGDAAHDRRRLAATGFLVLGPKMLAEDDPVKMEMDIIDEQVDAVGKAFLGMTLGCARCHDHKFDPIRMSDYYGLAGIFKSTKSMEHYRVVARWNERPMAAPSELARLERSQKAIADKKAEIEAVVKRAREAGAATDAGAAAAAESRFPQAEKDRLATLRKELARLEAECPKPPSVMAVAERTATDLPIHLRGNHLTLGQVVPRQFPAVLRRGDEPAIPADRSGRRELAGWLTRPDHPLTARVIVNRLWLWHFGEGLVRSVDNFGRLGERPTHPELLDWLATRLVARGWSLKDLHREIVLSATYRMSTNASPAAAAKDPENLLLSHRARRRLEAEAIRDTILMASGRLDRAMGGSLLRSGNREYVAGTASVNNTNYQSTRRSVYLPVIRSALYEVFQAFDFADPSTGAGRRDATTVAPQALCLMNSDLVMEAAEAMADSLLQEVADDDRPLVGLAYTRTLGREPTPAELGRALDFLRSYRGAVAGGGESGRSADPRRAASQALCRVLMGTSEMIYLD
jgi:mono/diheme cytochrome c family protein